MLRAGWVWLSVRTMVLTWLLGPGALEGVHFFLLKMCGVAVVPSPGCPSSPPKGLRRRLGVEGIRCLLSSFSLLEGGRHRNFTRHVSWRCLAWLLGCFSGTGH